MADIKIDISESKKDIYSKMQMAVQKAKGSLDGGQDTGEFEIPVALGKIKGQYFIHEGYIEVDIDKKPMLVSKKMIQDALEGFLEK